MKVLVPFSVIIDGTGRAVLPVPAPGTVRWLLSDTNQAALELGEEGLRTFHQTLTATNTIIPLLIPIKTRAIQFASGTAGARITVGFEHEDC